MSLYKLYALYICMSVLSCPWHFSLLTSLPYLVLCILPNHLLRVCITSNSSFLLSSLDQLNVSWSMLGKSTSKTKKMFFHLPSRVQVHWFHFSISKHFSEFTTLVRFGNKIHWPNYDNWIYLEYCWHEDILYYLLSVLTACACFETDLWMKAVENKHSKEKQTFSFIQLKRKYSSQLVE